MFGRASPKNLSLQLKGEVRRFKSPSDLAFALQTMSNPSAQFSTGLLTSSEMVLARELDMAKRSAARVLEARAGADESGPWAGRVLASVESRSITEQNDWRAVLTALNALGDEFEPYKRVTLNEYGRYLAALEQLVQGVYDHIRARPSAGPRQHPEKAKPMPAGQRSSLTIGDTEIPVPGRLGGDYTRLPNALAVTFDVAPGQALHLLLAHYNFGLVLTTPVLLIDNSGADYTFRAERATIGRNPDCDVVLGDCYPSVSRNHLLVERIDANQVMLTDTSSVGSFVSAADYPAKLDSVAGDTGE